MPIGFDASSRIRPIAELEPSPHEVGPTADPEICGHQVRHVPSVKNSGISIFQTIWKFFFNYKSGEQAPCLLSPNDDIASIPSPRTQGTIKKEKSLFSIRDFQKIASTRIFNLFGQPDSHDPVRRQLFKELQEYQEYQELNPHDLNARCQKLVQLEQTTCDYLATKNRDIHDSSLLSDLFFNKSDLRKDSEAAQYLLQGIALEKQKNLGALSCTITNVQRGDDLKPTVSGDMATLKVVDYVTENSTTPKTGYFKPVGNYKMKSIVGKRMGIPEISTAVANLSGRAVAVYEISKLLGFALVPKTFFATYDGDVGSLQEKAQGQHLIQEERQPYRFSKSEMNLPIQEILEGKRLIKNEDAAQISLASDQPLKASDQPLKLRVTQNGDGLHSEVVIVNNKNEVIQGDKLTKLLPQVIVGGKLMKKILTEEKERMDQGILERIDGTSWSHIEDLLLTDVSLCFTGNELFQDGQIVDNSKIPQLLAENKIQRTKKIVTAASNINFNDPVLQNELLDAQVLDFVTGQLDRHANNFIYFQDESNNWHVRLIDNDLACPEKFPSFDDLKSKFDDTPILKALPPILSKKTALSIEKLNVDDVTRVLTASGLSKEEIDATQSRLACLKEYVTELKRKGKVYNMENEMEKLNNNISIQQGNLTYYGRDQEVQQKHLKANQELI